MEGDIFPYFEEWNPDFVLKTLRADKTVIGSYNLFSGRYLNVEHPQLSYLSYTDEVVEASYDIPVGFDSAIRFIQIDDRALMPVNASTLVCQ